MACWYCWFNVISFQGTSFLHPGSSNLNARSVEATREISSNVQEAARGAQEVSSSITDILAASSSTGDICKNISTASDLLVSLADGLAEEVHKMLEK